MRGASMGGNVWKRMDLSRMEQLKLFTMFQQMKLAIMEKKKKKFASFFSPRTRADKGGKSKS